MQRHVQVTDEMDQELKSLFGDRITLRAPSFNPFGQQPSGIPNTAQDVNSLAAAPTGRSGEEALLRRMVAFATNVMERSGPTHTIAELVGPRCNVRQRTSSRSFAWSFGV